MLRVPTLFLSQSFDNFPAANVYIIGRVASQPRLSAGTRGRKVGEAGEDSTSASHWAPHHDSSWTRGSAHAQRSVRNSIVPRYRLNLIAIRTSTIMTCTSTTTISQRSGSPLPMTALPEPTHYNVTKLQGGYNAPAYHRYSSSSVSVGIDSTHGGDRKSGHGEFDSDSVDTRDGDNGGMAERDLFPPLRQQNGSGSNVTEWNLLPARQMWERSGEVGKNSGDSGGDGGGDGGGGHSGDGVSGPGKEARHVGGVGGGGGKAVDYLLAFANKKHSMQSNRPAKAPARGHGGGSGNTPKNAPVREHRHHSASVDEKYIGIIREPKNAEPYNYGAGYLRPKILAHDDLYNHHRGSGRSTVIGGDGQQGGHTSTGGGPNRENNPCSEVVLPIYCISSSTI